MIQYIPRGLLNAKPRSEIIAAMERDGFHMSDRDFRNEIAQIVKKKEELICTSVHGGYFIPLSLSEVEISNREDNSRISKLIAKREAKLSMALEMGLK